jgi:hypothetical protein
VLELVLKAQDLNTSEDNKNYINDVRLRKVFLFLLAYKAAYYDMSIDNYKNCFLY